MAASGQSRRYSKSEIRRVGIEILRVQDLRTKSAKKCGDLLGGHEQQVGQRLHIKINVRFLVKGMSLD